MNRNVKLMVIVIGAVAILCSCVVKDFQYMSTDSSDVDSVRISGEIDDQNKKRLNIYFWFDQKVDQQHIDDISMVIDGFDLSYITVSSPSKGINWFSDERYKRTRFGELPLNARITKIDSSQVVYCFSFLSPSPIKQGSLYVNYKVRLEKGTLVTSVVKMKLTQSKRLRIH